MVLPLADLEAQQFPLLQSCILPKLVSAAEDVRKASAEAERRIDAHVLKCRSHFLPYIYFQIFFKRLVCSAGQSIECCFLHGVKNIVELKKSLSTNLFISLLSFEKVWCLSLD